jgi:hypothetical protein
MSDAQSTLDAHQLALEAPGSGGKVLVFVVVDGLPGLPDTPVRAQLAKLANETAHEVAAHATVVRSSGFSGSALRSVMTAIFALSRADYPKRVFSSVEDAAEWLANHKAGLSPVTLCGAFAELEGAATLNRAS